jgi:diguanylate cyclase (GGDEF)-like protein/PAS domain S-box-containing protein
MNARDQWAPQPSSLSAESDHPGGGDGFVADPGGGAGVERLALAIEGAEAGVWDRNIVTGEIYYSPGWKHMLGFSGPEIGNRIEESYTRVHPDDLAYVQAAMQDHFDGKTGSYRAEYRLRCKDGSYKWVSAHGKVLSRDRQGNALRMVGTMTDITAKHQALEELHRVVDLLTDLTNEIPDLVFQYRRMPDGVSYFPYASSGIARIFGIAPADVAADASVLDTIIHPDDVAAYHDSFRRSAARLEPWTHEFRVVSPTRQVRWIQGNARPQRIGDGATLWHGLMTEVTERKGIEVELRRLAVTDPLTGLPNRRFFMSRMEAELARLRHDRRKPAAIVMIDLDHFKDTNDRYGHASGDKVLRHFVGILGSCLRETDVAGRIGGEEFAVLLPASDQADAMAFGTRLLRRLGASPYVEDNLRIGVSASLGVTVMSPDDSTVDESLARGDRALYRAKGNGRNRIECAS